MTDDRQADLKSEAQLASPSYRLAALDQDFLLGESMRGVRFLLEFAKADEALRAWGVRSTIVVFGSARVREDARGARRTGTQRPGASDASPRNAAERSTPRTACATTSSPPAAGRG